MAILQDDRRSVRRAWCPAGELASLWSKEDELLLVANPGAQSGYTVLRVGLLDLRGRCTAKLWVENNQEGRLGYPIRRGELVAGAIGLVRKVLDRYPSLLPVREIS